MNEISLTGNIIDSGYQMKILPTIRQQKSKEIEII